MNEELTEQEIAEMEEAKRKAEEAQKALEESIANGTYKNGFVQPKIPTAEDIEKAKAEAEAEEKASEKDAKSTKKANVKPSKTK